MVLFLEKIEESKGNAAHWSSGHMSDLNRHESSTIWPRIDDLATD